jgi:membrane-anchored protein YejM (alkaline phosphatase superfamily)
VDYKFQPKLIKRTLSEGQIQLKTLNDSVELVTSNDGEDFYPANTKRWFESGSSASVHLESSLKLFHENEKPGNVRKSHSKLNIFHDKGFLGRRASFMRLNIRRNTVA